MSYDFDEDTKSSHTLFYADQNNKAIRKAHGAKLIDFEKGRLSVASEGTKLLKDVDKSKNVNVVFIFGNARSGKSFMMNCIVGAPGVFKVINSSAPCTKGVEMSSFIAEHPALAIHVGVESPADAPNLAFVDVEGQGAEDGTYDTMLALPLLLTSRVVLFNHKGAPTVNDMLSKLGVLARAAEYIELQDEEEAHNHKRRQSTGSEEDGGGEADALDPEAENEHKHNGEIGTRKRRKKKKFGHLHVLFRDFSFEGDRDEVYQQLMGKEKVVATKSLKKSGEHDIAKAAKERNDIRQLLLTNFESVNVWLFKQPASADRLREYKELPEELVDKEFTQNVHGLLTKIAEQTQTPTLFNDKALNGPRLVSLLTQICSAINDGGMVNVPSVYRAMEKETVVRIATECIRKFETIVEELRKELPKSAGDVKMRLDQMRNGLFSDYEAELADCLLKEEVATKKLEMTIAFDKMEDVLNKENRMATHTRVRDVVISEMDKTKDAFSAFCTKALPVEDVKQIEAAFERFRTTGLNSIKDQLAFLPEVYNNGETQAVISDHEEKLREFYNMKLIQNESMLKDLAIARLREEAIKAKQELIEQNKKLEQYLEEEKATTKQMEQQLTRLKTETQVEQQKSKQTQQLLEQSQKEINALRNKKRKCVIL